MAYTAWEKVRTHNMKNYGVDAPCQPPEFTSGDIASNLEKQALAFIREDCEGLGFDPALADCTDSTGYSLSKEQIPYNMEKDTNRLCFERALHKFMQTGTKNDAFDVYFCYLELFVGKYGRTKKMIEMLAEFEMNAGSLLMSHRDHYTHSAYVFVLGLAIFHNNKTYRDSYRLTHMENKDATPAETARHFLEYWGLTSLFHDIGYPFELPFEQVKSYFGGTIKEVPFVTYKGVDAYVLFTEEEKAHFKKLFGAEFESLTALIAHGIASRLGDFYGCESGSLKRDVLDIKPSCPDAFGGYMDHGVFSGLLLYKQLAEVSGVESIKKEHLDCFSAIVLHNSIFKRVIAQGRPLPINLHPLAFMLMLCDELQCWDRTSYGRNSVSELHPMGFDLTFEGSTIKTVYYYDRYLEKRKENCRGTYRKMTGEGKVKFVRDIEEIVESDGSEGRIGLELSVAFRDVTELKNLNTYLSESNYIHLYNFAVLVHGRRKKTSNPDITFEELEEHFNNTSLEYKLSVLERTKNYAKYLNSEGMFYTDKPVVYEQVTESAVDDSIERTMGNLEHQRWLDEKVAMGWVYGDCYIGMPDEKAMRERFRLHVDIVDYDSLSEEAKDKDKEPLREMLPILETMDGIRIYKIPGFKKSQNKSFVHH